MKKWESSNLHETSNFLLLKLLRFNEAELSPIPKKILYKKKPLVKVSFTMRLACNCRVTSLLERMMVLLNSFDFNNLI